MTHRLLLLARRQNGDLKNFFLALLLGTKPRPQRNTLLKSRFYEESKELFIILQPKMVQSDTISRGCGTTISWP